MFSCTEQQVHQVERRNKAVVSEAPRQTGTGLETEPKQGSDGLLWSWSPHPRPSWSLTWEAARASHEAACLLQLFQRGGCLPSATVMEHLPAPSLWAPSSLILSMGLSGPAHSPSDRQARLFTALVPARFKASSAHLASGPIHTERLWFLVCLSRKLSCPTLTADALPNLTIWTASSLVAQMVKNPLTMQETGVWSLSSEDPLEEGMATHSSILAWEIPWTEEPRGLQSMGLQRVGHDWAADTILFYPKLGTYHMEEGWKLGEEKPVEVPEKLICLLWARIRMDIGDLEDFLFFSVCICYNYFHLAKVWYFIKFSNHVETVSLYLCFSVPCLIMC